MTEWDKQFLCGGCVFLKCDPRGERYVCVALSAIFEPEPRDPEDVRCECHHRQGDPLPERKYFLNYLDQ